MIFFIFEKLSRNPGFSKVSALTKWEKRENSNNDEIWCKVSAWNWSPTKISICHINNSIVFMCPSRLYHSPNKLIQTLFYQNSKYMLPKWFSMWNENCSSFFDNDISKRHVFIHIIIMILYYQILFSCY